MISAAGPRIGDLRARRETWLAAALAIASVPLLLYLGRHLNFLGDEWTFVVGRRGPGAAVFFLPHNEHWSTIPVLVYRALFATVGLRDYWPYLLVLELLHATAAVCLFMLIRRRSGGVLALWAMALFLFLGRGAENILWAFQIGFVGSVTCGLIAMVLIDSPAAGAARVALGSVALLLSLMFSGMGIFFCVAVAVDLLLDPRRRAFLLALILPGLAYVAWFALYGAAGISSHRSPLSLNAVGSLASYLPAGIGAALAGLLGLSSRWAAALLAATAALLAVRWYQRGRVDSRILGAAAGLMGQYAATGLVRGQLGDQQAAASKYIYVGAAFLLLIVADALQDVPWRSLVGGLLMLVLAFGLVDSAIHLRLFARDRTSLTAVVDAELETLLSFRGAPAMALDRDIHPPITPLTAGQFFTAVDALGSPVPSIDVAGLARLRPTAVSQTMTAVFGPSLQVREGTSAEPGPCQTFQGAATAYADLVVPDGGAVSITSTVAGVASLSLAYRVPPAGAPQRQWVLTPSTITTVTVPATGAPIDWRLVVGLPPAGQISICGGRA
jgi:hypothetical protein